MIKLDIPGFGHLALEHLVTDFTGTLAADGRLIPGVREALTGLSGKLKVHVLTSDTFGTAEKELSGIDCDLYIMTGEDHDVQKETFARKLGADGVVAFGNGRNDIAMLRLARIGVAVSQGEGCATAALVESDILVTSILDGLGLLTDTRRLTATLRF
jgi:soluble P-type ATPase